MHKNIILSLGNLYVETNYLGIETGGQDFIEVGKEYSAPNYEVRLGGSAVNFITQINKYGLPAGIIGKCGQDDNSETLLKLLKKEGIRTDLIKKSNKHTTNVDTGLIVKHSAQNIQVVAGDANQSLSFEDIDLRSTLFEEVRAVYFGGSFKQKNLWPKYPKIFKSLKDRGIEIFIDHGRVPVDADLHWIGILKEILPFTAGYFPNEMEIKTVTGEEKVSDALDKVMEWGAKLIAVKMGPDGCLVRDGKNNLKVPGYTVNAVSTVGAGDCFNASFIMRFLKDGEIIQAAKFANAAAAIRVSKNYQPDENEVLKFLNNE